MACTLKLAEATRRAEFCAICPDRLEAARHERLEIEHIATELRLHADIAREHALSHQQEVLRRESDHRLLNNLQMVASLLSLQSRTEANAEAASSLSVAADRVHTMARIHRHLHSSDGSETVALKNFLDELCRDCSKIPTSADRGAQPIVVEGIELRLPTAVGFPLGLIVNELLTNAIKYGKGRISVKLEPRSGTACALSVCNHGSTLPDGFDPVASKGLGMSLVSSLVEQIGGELLIDRGEDDKGTRFTVLFSR